MKYFLLAICFFAADAYAANQASFTSEPEWVTPSLIPDSRETHHARIRYGVHYVHFGRQIRVPVNGNPAYYYRYVTRITNQTGLDDQSQINVRYDPIYERVLFHKLNIVRDGKTIQKLNSTRVSYLDQEDELDYQLYNGKKTLNLLLDDLRVDDVLDYSYTIEGYNPVHQNKFNAEFTMQWGVPVASMYLRLLWQKESQLNSKLVNSDWEVAQSETEQGTEYIINVANVEPVELEDDTPSWVDPYAIVYFSEQANWQEIVDWGRELFPREITTAEEVKSVARNIESSSPDRSTKISRALQFVQDEIRYVGIELGENSHQAVAAETTLERRYGDCKDKSTLMISILEAMGIEAFPALVNTAEKNELSKRLPSTQAFDHAIVAVPHEDKIYWLDPTRQYQVGKLSNIYQPDYGLALLLKQGSQNLIPMKSFQVESGYDILEHYDLTGDNFDQVKLSVETQYFGWRAESEISSFERNGVDQFKAGYLEFYQGYYPLIEQIEVSGIGVDKDNFRFKISEKYLVKEFWGKEEDSQRDVGWVYSNAVSSMLDEPDKTSRSQDYELSFPWTINQTIRISLPDQNWDFVDSEFNELNDFFEFRRSQKYNADTTTVYLKYSYTSKSNHVPATAFPEYLAALGRARQELDFGFYKEDLAQTSTNYAAIWIAVILMYFGIIILILALWYRDKKRNPFAGTMQYYPMDNVKFLYMWIVSWGLFPVYWFYKNWKYEKSERTRSEIMPTMRGLFFQFWYYPLYKRLSRNQKLITSGQRSPGRPGAIVFSVVFFTVITLSAIYDAFALPLLLISALVALPLLKMINAINYGNQDALKYNSRWSLRHFLLSIIFFPLFVFTIGPALGLLPSESVVPGDRLLGHDINFMQRAGIIRPGDEIKFFYSDAMLMIRDDGNGITNRHVFSYWIDENDNFNIETVEFGDIGDIKVFWSSGFSENTIVEVYRNNQSKIILFLSSTGGKDKLFVRELRTLWGKTGKAGNQS